jgi:hypothetical protein
MDDQQPTAEAKELVATSERVWWRLAELTSQQVAAGADRGQWAADIGVHYRTVGRWLKVWERFGPLPADERPSYAQAWRTVAGDDPLPGDEPPPA